MTEKDAKATLEAHRSVVMKLPGVVAISFGISPTDPDKRCILVHVTTKGWPPGLPRALDGFDVEVVRVRRGFRAQ